MVEELPVSLDESTGSPSKPESGKKATGQQSEVASHDSKPAMMPAQ